MNEELMTLEELQTILCIGKNTAYRLLLTKEIKAFKIGRLWKIPKSSVLEYIQKSVSEQNSSSKQTT